MNPNPDIVRCHVCGREMDLTGNDAVRVNNGYVHEDCLKEYCKDVTTVHRFSYDFAVENFEKFMEFVGEAL